MFIHHPNDFQDVFALYKARGNISVNILKNHYGIKAHSVINRWLDETGLHIEKTNKKTEESLDIPSLVNDIISCQYSKDELKKKYGVKYSVLKRVCLSNEMHHTDYLKHNYFETVKYFDEFSEYVQAHGKVATAKKYNTTLSTIVAACKRNDIGVERYKGSKARIHDYESLLTDLKDDGVSFSQISKKYNIAKSVIDNILIKENIVRETVFDKWNNEYQKIVDNKDAYFEENKTSTLLDIAQKHNISIEHLKRLFREENVSVILHSQNKSRGEIDVREYLHEITGGEECVSKRFTFNGKCFEIDCLLESHSLGIEYCGEYWHNDINKEKNYHQEKYLWAREQNIRLLHIFEHEWITKQPIVKSIIMNKLGKSKRIFARKCDIGEVSSIDAKKFFDCNHIQGGIYGNINIGLYHDNQLVSCLSISKSRFTKKYEYEILRFSHILNTTVIGGLSKLITFFIKKYNPNSIVTYADLRYGDGNGYMKCGFKYSHTTKPNYWYYDRYSDSGFESRVKYQKHKLEKLLPDFRPELTEYQNMTNNGYFRIYDCGNNVFVWMNSH